MPKPTQDSKTDLPDPQLLTALTTMLSKHISLTLHQTHLTASEVWAVLSYAAVQRTSLHAAAQDLPHAPSGNRVREVLMAGLPSRPVLQGQLNRLLRQQVPPRIRRGKTAYEIAIDLTLLPYHGQPDTSPSELLRQTPKDGTTHCHGYATAALVHHQQRYVLAFCFVAAGTSMVTLVRTLLNRVRQLGVRIKLVLLDKGFYAAAVFRTLDRRGLSYIVPARLGKTHQLFRRRGSYRTQHWLRHAQGGTYRVTLVVVKRFQRGKQGKRQANWQGYCVGGWTRQLSFAQVRWRYRQRFGIETSFRQMNQVRARTSTQSPLLRLLYVGLALLLVNGYLTWRTLRPPGLAGSGAPRVRTLHQLAVALQRTIEGWFRLRRNTSCQVNLSLS